jgi:hypothetical protein
VSSGFAKYPLINSDLTSVVVNALNYNLEIMITIPDPMGSKD